MKVIVIIDDEKEKELCSLSLEHLPTVDDEIEIKGHDMTVMQVMDLDDVAPYRHAIVVRRAVKLSNLF